jgi:hypothetical protein
MTDLLEEIITLITEDFLIPNKMDLVLLKKCLDEIDPDHQDEMWAAVERYEYVTKHFKRTRTPAQAKKYFLNQAQFVLMGNLRSFVDRHGSKNRRTISVDQQIEQRIQFLREFFEKTLR